jgi:small-conductance mechanosensitive channel
MCAFFLVFALNRNWLSKFTCLLVGLNDPYLIKDVVKRVDLSSLVLFVMMAVLPFVGLIPGKATPELLRIGNLLAWFVAAHIVIVSSDIIFSRFYLNKRQTPVPAVLRFAVLAIIYTVLAFLLLDWALHVNVVPLLATSSVIAAVLGLALQDTLRNIFAGLTMILEKSIKQGDWVNFHIDADKTRIGQIMEIGWRSTKIRTFNNNLAIIPNVMLIQSELVNYDRPTPTHGKVLDFPLPVKRDPEHVCRLLCSAAATVPGVLKEPAPDACARDVKIDQITYQLRFWIEDIQKQETIASNVIKACWGGIFEHE